MPTRRAAQALVVPAFCCTKASNDRMPPSPALSARRISTTYLTVMTSNRLQKISDSMPSTVISSPAPPATAVASFSA